MTALARGEEQRLQLRPNMQLEVFQHGRQDAPGYVDPPDAGFRLRVTDDGPAPDMDHGSLDEHDASLDVDVLAAELCHLAEPHGAPPREQNQGSVPRRHSPDDDVQLRKRGGLGPVDLLGGAGPFDSARVGCDQVIAVGAVDDRPQQRVGVPQVSPDRTGLTGVPGDVFLAAAASAAAFFAAAVVFVEVCQLRTVATESLSTGTSPRSGKIMSSSKRLYC